MEILQEKYVLICSNLHSIALTKTDSTKWSKKVKKEGKAENCFSLFFPIFPCLSLLL